MPEGPAGRPGLAMEPTRLAFSGALGTSVLLTARAAGLGFPAAAIAMAQAFAGEGPDGRLETPLRGTACPSHGRRVERLTA